MVVLHLDDGPSVGVLDGPAAGAVAGCRSAATALGLDPGEHLQVLLRGRAKAASVREVVHVADVAGQPGAGGLRPGRRCSSGRRRRPAPVATSKGSESGIGA